MKHTAKILAFVVGIIVTFVGTLYNWNAQTIDAGLLGLQWITGPPVLDYYPVTPAYLIPVYFKLEMVPWAWGLIALGFIISVSMFAWMASLVQSGRKR